MGVSIGSFVWVRFNYVIDCNSNRVILALVIIWYNGLIHETDCYFTL